MLREVCGGPALNPAVVHSPLCWSRTGLLQCSLSSSAGIMLGWLYLKAGGGGGWSHASKEENSSVCSDFWPCRYVCTGFGWCWWWCRLASICFIPGGLDCSVSFISHILGKVCVHGRQSECSAWPGSFEGFCGSGCCLLPEAAQLQIW